MMDDLHRPRRLPERMPDDPLQIPDDPLQIELDLVSALRLTAAPPQAWIQAAIAIPTTLADLAAIDRLIDDTGFRAAFAADARRAIIDAGLDPSPPLVHAVRERLGP